MRSNFLDQAIAGRAVAEVLVDDELHFHLGDDCRITVINPWAFTGGTTADLKGRVLASIEQDDVAFRFRFVGGAVLTVDLSEPVWMGPEAIVFQGPGDLIVVVN